MKKTVDVLSGVPLVRTDRKSVTLDQLRRVRGNSGAKIDPNGSPKPTSLVGGTDPGPGNG